MIVQSYDSSSSGAEIVLKKRKKVVLMTVLYVQFTKKSEKKTRLKLKLLYSRVK